MNLQYLPCKILQDVESYDAYKWEDIDWNDSSLIQHSFSEQ